MGMLFCKRKFVLKLVVFHCTELSRITYLAPICFSLIEYLKYSQFLFLIVDVNVYFVKEKICVLKLVVCHCTVLSRITYQSNTKSILDTFIIYPYVKENIIKILQK